MKHHPSSGQTRTRWALGDRLVVSFLLFVVMLIVRWEVIDSPPFYDFAVGIWREAEFLERTNWDYVSLRYDCQPHLSDEGGPRSYVVSIVPGLLALFFRFVPPHATLVIYHLLVLAVAAWGMATLVDLLHRRVGWLGALCSALACLSTPVLATQVDMLGFEIFLVAVAVSWLRAMDQGRSVYAMALSVLAFSIKATGSILTATLLVYLVVRALGESIRDRRIAWNLVGLSLAAGATLAGESLILRWSGAFEQQQGSRLPLLMAGIWFPDVLMLLGAIGVLAAVNLWGLGRQSNIWNVGVKILETGRDQPAAWCSVVVLAALAVAVSGVRFIPRYAALAVPLVYTILPGLAASAIGRGWMTGAMALITLLNLINWNGRLFPDGEAGLERIAHLPGIVLRREGSIRERSHEYLAIHQANLQAMHRACQEPEEIPIVTTEPYSCFLRFPALGVVKKPRAVYSFDPVGPVSLSNIASLADFERDRPTEVVVLRDTVVFNTVRAQAEVLPPQESDRVLFAETPELPTTLVVYRKRLDPSLGQSSEDWLRRARGKPFISAAMLWSAYSSRGAGSLYALAEQEATKTAWEPESSLVLAMSAARMGQWSLVVDHLLHAEARTMIGSDRRTYPANPLLPVRSNGLLRTLDAMLADARHEARTLALASCLEDAPFLRSGWGRYRLGLDLLEDGDPRTARGVFREVLRSIPTFWPAELGLIKVDIAESKSAEALRRLEELVAKHPDAIEPIVLLAQLHGKVGRSPPEVIQKLRDYLVQWPDSPGVREALQKSLGTDQPRAE